MNNSKIKLSFVLLIVSTCSHFAQTITSSKGGDAILFQGTGIDFDVADEQIGFTFNNYSSSSSNMLKKDHGLLIGSELKVSNSNSQGFLFKGGDYQPTSTLGGTLGWYWSNRSELIQEYQRSNKAQFSNYATKRLLSLKVDSLFKIESIKDFERFFNAEELKEFNVEKAKIHGAELKSNLDSYLTAKLKDKSGKVIISYDKMFVHLRSLYIVELTKDSVKTAYLNQIITGLEKEVEEEVQKVNEIEKKIQLEYKNKLNGIIGSYWKASIFAVGGINAEKFKHFKSIDSANYNNGFESLSSRGSYFGVGLNINLPVQGQLTFFKRNEKKKMKSIYLFRNMVFGAKYTYSETSNFGLLKKQTYKLSQSYSNSSGQTLLSTTDITAYAGDFTKLYEGRLNLDLIKVFNYDSISIVSDLYVINKKVNKLELIPETTDVGLSLSFFKPAGKFMGGFYLEVPDWDNSIEKRKEEPNLRDRKNRMTFGVFATYTFGSLFNSTLFAPKSE